MARRLCDTPIVSFVTTLFFLLLNISRLSDTLRVSEVNTHTHTHAPTPSSFLYWNGSLKNQRTVFNTGVRTGLVRFLFQKEPSVFSSFFKTIFSFNEFLRLNLFLEIDWFFGFLKPLVLDCFHKEFRMSPT